MTYAEKLKNGLLALGWREDKTDRSKYTAFTHPDPIKRQFKLFVGPNGALRKGECASRSYSIGDASHQSEFYKHVIAQGEQGPYA